MEAFTEDQLEILAARVDAQLLVLQRSQPVGFTPTDAKQVRDLAKFQRDAIAQATGDDPDDILKRVRQAARRDLCQPGGILYQQWQKWKEIATKDALKIFGGILVGMGLSGTVLQIVAVAVVVYVLHLGAEAFCHEG